MTFHPTETRLQNNEAVSKNMKEQNLNELYDLLNRASLADRTNLQRLIGAGFGPEPRLLCDHFRFLRAGVLGQLFDRRSYKQLVTDVADHVGIDWGILARGRNWRDLSTHEIEDAIVVTTLQKVFQHLPDVDRRRIAIELGKESRDPNLVYNLVSGGVLILARASGFQVYLLATTATAALAGTLGIALPFAVYTTLTSALGIVLGPIGWIGFGFSLLLGLNTANWSRLVPGVIYLSYINHKLRSEMERRPTGSGSKYLKT